MPQSLDSVTCAADGRAFTPHDEIVMCSECGSMHHARCWAENKKCTTHRCSGKPIAIRILTVAEAPTGISTEDLHAALEDLHDKIERSASRRERATFEALTSLRNTVTSAFNEKKDRETHFAAKIEDLRLGLRALDLQLARRLTVPSTSSAHSHGAPAQPKPQKNP